MWIGRNKALPAAIGLIALALAAVALVQARRRSTPVPLAEPASTSDAIVVGAGVAGLSAAYELAKGGARVVVIDIASVFGGHAVMATGDVCIVDTPFQEAQGIHAT